MTRSFRHLVLQRVFWSKPGLGFLRFAAGFARRWNYAVMNRSLIAQTNGENWLVSQLSAKPLVIDVGFHRGEFSAEVLRQRPAARIIAFEPARSMHAYFRTTFAGTPAIELVPCAVGSTKGKSIFYDTATGTSSLLDLGQRNAEKYEVPVMRLDDFFGERRLGGVDFLKIDAEGFDLPVLEGAAEVLATQRIAMFTFEHNSPWIENRRFLKDAVDFLATKPYTLFRLFNGFLGRFNYSHHAERHDLGCMYVGVSHDQLSRAPLPTKIFPGV